jgi:hypothetical protein
MFISRVRAPRFFTSAWFQIRKKDPTKRLITSHALEGKTSRITEVHPSISGACSASSSTGGSCCSGALAPMTASILTLLARRSMTTWSGERSVTDDAVSPESSGRPYSTRSSLYR